VDKPSLIEMAYEHGVQLTGRGAHMHHMHHMHHNMHMDKPLPVRYTTQIPHASIQGGVQSQLAGGTRTAHPLAPLRLACSPRRPDHTQPHTLPVRYGI
jgi:hypothetical protein